MDKIKLRKILRAIIFTIVRNLLAFLAGGILGVLAVIIYAKYLIEHAVTKDIGLGIVAVALALLILYGITFGVIGGIAVVIIYNIVRFIRRKIRK